MTTATTASMVSPLPNPSALYIAGANNGKPKPQRERKNATAASAMMVEVRKRVGERGVMKVDPT